MEKKNYCIMRLAKIKCRSAFGNIENHAKEREKLRHRKHPELQHENKIFTSKLYSEDESILQRFDRLTSDVKIRKNAVLAYEFIFAYTPEAHGSFDEREWIRANQRWLTETFGKGNTIHFRYEADESGRHCHAVVSPLIDGRLNARHFTGGKIALSKLQDSYAEKMKEFGLERGNRFLDNPEIPSARHKTLAEYWREQEVKEIIKNVFGDEER